MKLFSSFYVMLGLVVSVLADNFEFIVDEITSKSYKKEISFDLDLKDVKKSCTLLISTKSRSGIISLNSGESNKQAINKVVKSEDETKFSVNIKNEVDSSDEFSVLVMTTNSIVLKKQSVFVTNYFKDITFKVDSSDTNRVEVFVDSKFPFKILDTETKVNEGINNQFLLNNSKSFIITPEDQKEENVVIYLLYYPVNEFNNALQFNQDEENNFGFSSILTEFSFEFFFAASKADETSIRNYYFDQSEELTYAYTKNSDKLEDLVFDGNSKLVTQVLNKSFTDRLTAKYIAFSTKLAKSEKIIFEVNIEVTKNLEAFLKKPSNSKQSIVLNKSVPQLLLIEVEPLQSVSALDNQYLNVFFYLNVDAKLSDIYFKDFSVSVPDKINENLFSAKINPIKKHSKFVFVYLENKGPEVVTVDVEIYFSDSKCILRTHRNPGDKFSLNFVEAHKSRVLFKNKSTDTTLIYLDQLTKGSSLAFKIITINDETLIQSAFTEQVAISNPLLRVDAGTVVLLEVVSDLGSDLYLQGFDNSASDSQSIFVKISLVATKLTLKADFIHSFEIIDGGPTDIVKVVTGSEPPHALSRKNPIELKSEDVDFEITLSLDSTEGKEVIVKISRAGLIATSHIEITLQDETVVDLKSKQGFYIDFKASIGPNIKTLEKIFTNISNKVSFYARISVPKSDKEIALPEANLLFNQFTEFDQLIELQGKAVQEISSIFLVITFAEGQGDSKSTVTSEPLFRISSKTKVAYSSSKYIKLIYYKENREDDNKIAFSFLSTSVSNFNLNLEPFFKDEVKSTDGTFQKVIDFVPQSSLPAVIFKVLSSSHLDFIACITTFKGDPNKNYEIKDPEQPKYINSYRISNFTWAGLYSKDVQNPQVDYLGYVVKNEMTIDYSVFAALTDSENSHFARTYNFTNKTQASLVLDQGEYPAFFIIAFDKQTNRFFKYPNTVKIFSCVKEQLGFANTVSSSKSVCIDIMGNQSRLISFSKDVYQLAELRPNIPVAEKILIRDIANDTALYTEISLEEGTIAELKINGLEEKLKYRIFASLGKISGVNLVFTMFESVSNNLNYIYMPSSGNVNSLIENNYYVSKSSNGKLKMFALFSELNIRSTYRFDIFAAEAPISSISTYFSTSDQSNSSENTNLGKLDNGKSFGYILPKVDLQQYQMIVFEIQVENPKNESLNLVRTVYQTAFTFNLQVAASSTASVLRYQNYLEDSMNYIYYLASTVFVNNAGFAFFNQELDLSIAKAAILTKAPALVTLSDFTSLVGIQENIDLRKNSLMLKSLIVPNQLTIITSIKTKSSQLVTTINLGTLVEYEERKLEYPISSSKERLSIIKFQNMNSSLIQKSLYLFSKSNLNIALSYIPIMNDSEFNDLATQAVVDTASSPFIYKFTQTVPQAFDNSDFYLAAYSKEGDAIAKIFISQDYYNYGSLAKSEETRIYGLGGETKYFIYAPYTESSQKFSYQVNCDCNIELTEISEFIGLDFSKSEFKKGEANKLIVNQYAKENNHVVFKVLLHKTQQAVIKVSPVFNQDKLTDYLKAEGRNMAVDINDSVSFEVKDQLSVTLIKGKGTITIGNNQEVELTVPILEVFSSLTSIKIKNSSTTDSLSIYIGLAAEINLVTVSEVSDLRLQVGANLLKIKSNPNHMTIISFKSIKLLKSILVIPVDNSDSSTTSKKIYLQQRVNDSIYSMKKELVLDFNILEPTSLLIVVSSQESLTSQVSMSQINELTYNPLRYSFDLSNSIYMKASNPKQFKRLAYSIYKQPNRVCVAAFGQNLIFLNKEKMFEIGLLELPYNLIAIKCNDILNDLIFSGGFAPDDYTYNDLYIERNTDYLSQEFTDESVSLVLIPSIYFLANKKASQVKYIFYYSSVMLETGNIYKIITKDQLDSVTRVELDNPNQPITFKLKESKYDVSLVLLAVDQISGASFLYDSKIIQIPELTEKGSAKSGLPAGAIVAISIGSAVLFIIIVYFLWKYFRGRIVKNSAIENENLVDNKA